MKQATSTKQASKPVATVTNTAAKQAAPVPANTAMQALVATVTAAPVTTAGSRTATVAKAVREKVGVEATAPIGVPVAKMPNHLVARGYATGLGSGFPESAPKAFTLGPKLQSGGNPARATYDRAMVEAIQAVEKAGKGAITQAALVASNVTWDSCKAYLKRGWLKAA